MKKLLSIISVISAALLVFACAPKETYTPGTPDDPNCMGVFFPTQTLKEAFAPEDPFCVDVKVSRGKSAGDATVPVKIYGNEDEYFFVSPIEFIDGQSETTCSIYFSKDIPLGKEYNLTVAIEDPAYASIYNKNASFISVPVVVENYKYLGDAEFSDKFLFETNTGEVLSFKVPLYQNQMDLNEFRLIAPYDEAIEYFGFKEEGMHIHDAVQKLNFKILEPGTKVMKDTKYEIEIKSEDIVYFEDYYTGVYMPSRPAEIVAYSPFQNSVFVLGQSEADLLPNKVVNYQDPDAEGKVLPAVVNLYPCYLFDDKSGYGYGNYDVTILFPGGSFVNYDLSISVAECSGGQSPVTFGLGKDVKAVKYKVYPGELTAKEIRQQAALIVGGEIQANSLDINLPRVFVTCEKTGLYTIVAVGFDKNGNQQNTASAVFGYVKPGDEEDVAITFDAALEETPARYAKDKYTATNSLLMYIVGNDISQVRYQLMKTIEYNEDPEAAQANVKESGTLLSAGELEKVNAVGGYVTVTGGLAPLTSYTLVVYGYNGYVGKTVVSSLSTSGLPPVEVGVGNYNFAVLAPIYSGPSSLTLPRTLMFNPNTEDEYSIPNFDFLDLMDYPNEEDALDFKKKGNEVSVSLSYVGDDLLTAEFKTYVDMYAAAAEVTPQFLCDFFVSAGKTDFGDFYNNKRSSYDPETDTYTFCVIYFENDFGFYNYGFETLSMNPENESVAASSIQKAATGVANRVEGVKLSTDVKSILASGRRIVDAEREIKAANVEVKPAGSVEVKGGVRSAARKIFGK